MISRKWEYSKPIASMQSETRQYADSMSSTPNETRIAGANGFYLKHGTSQMQHYHIKLENSYTKCYLLGSTTFLSQFHLSSNEIMQIVFRQVKLFQVKCNYETTAAVSTDM